MGSADSIAFLVTQLEQFVATQFEETAAREVIREGVLSHPALAALDRADLEAALEQVLAGRGASGHAHLRPRLLVDWGELPQVGRAARPLFSLISETSRGRPTVRVSVDRSLDTDPTDPLRQLRSDEPGIWTFYIPFSLTSNGLDARPGLYVIDVEATFPHAAAGEPRFLQTRIRLSIPSDGEGKRELVIDGDGQSVVNLAGHDLRSFSRVVLKGDDKSVINLQNFSQQIAEPPPPDQAVVFEYELKVNHHIQQRLPQPVEVADASKTDSLSLVMGDRRVHVIARKRATFGRSRENDVCLRFLPRSSSHDEGSRGISRTHMALDLTDDGLVLTDEKSAKGVDVDCDPVKGDTTFSYLDAHGGRHVDLPSPLTADRSLELELMLFGHDPDNPDFHSQLEWDDVCFDSAGEPASRLWQIARGSGVETARMRRLNNLPNEEYVFLYRHATIGRSAKDHAIVVPGVGSSGGELRLLYAGRMFWLHSDGHVAISLDGVPVEGPCLIPLRFGHHLTIGSDAVYVARMAQCYIDDDPVIPEVPQASTLGMQETAGIPLPPATPIVAPVKAVGGADSPQPPPPLPGAAAIPQVPPALPVSAPVGNPARAEDPVQRALASVALIACREGHGSAFLAAPGLLVTNYHVVADDPIESLTATFYDPVTHAPSSLPVSLVAEDPLHDLAVLSVESDLPHLELAEQFQHQNGHRIAIIGSPGLGLGGERLENVVTDGRLGPLFRHGGGLEQWALSITVNPGNSGGPVLDATTGSLLGVTVAKFTTADGLALAVPHDVLLKRLQEAVRGSESAAALASSLHRQRYCLRTMAGFVGGLSAACREIAEQRDGLLEQMSRESADSLMGHEGASLAGSVCALIDAIDTDLQPQLRLLGADSGCPASVLQGLESSWSAVLSIRELFDDGVGGRAQTLRFQRAGDILGGLEDQFAALSDELNGSLLSGKTVFDEGSDRSPEAAPSTSGDSLSGLHTRVRHSPLGKLFAKPHATPRYLTKSRFTLACSCPTKLYYTAKNGEYANSKSTDPTMEALANEGNRVGTLAQLYFPGGVLIDTLNHEAALARTAELLEQPEVTIFEAAFRHGDLFIRTDILRKTPAGLELIEVKSKGYSPDQDGDFTTASGISTAWLPYIRDVAFQKHVLQHACPEMPVRAHLFLPDKTKPAPSDSLAVACMAARRDARVELSEEDRASPIMRIINVDPQCEQVLSSRYSLGDRSLSFADFCNTLGEHYRDDTKIQASLSPACLACEFDASPFALAMGEKSGKRECWETLLGWTNEDFEKPQAFEICGLSAPMKKLLLAERRLHLDQVLESDIEPASDGRPGLSQSQRQWLQVSKAVSNDRSSFLDRDGLQAEMASWRYPLHLIDFETCRAAIPFHRGSRPLDLVAFQFSHHVMHADGSLEHAGEFLLAERCVNPHAAFIESLADQIGRDEGTVLHYAPHEVSTLRAIAGQFRARRGEFDNVDALLAFIDTIAPPGNGNAARQVVDLCSLVKRFYYSPSMGGSNSIKQVLPAILNESEFLQAKYSRPIYGAVGGVPSRNFRDIAWVNRRDGAIRDPYQLLPQIAWGGERDSRPPPKALATIRNGGAAMQAYADLVLGVWTDDHRRGVEAALLRYCELDTLAMAFIVEAWREWCL